MIILPDEFKTQMRRRLGTEFDAFLSCYEQDSYTGLRVNTGKIRTEDFLARMPFSLTPVPWTDNGFYYEAGASVTKHPYYYAGLYYIQEPSAMLPASRLPVSPGDVVLDLCAAPGGKATELSSRLQGRGLLVANDISASRAGALLKNLSVWGSRNCCITGETPQRLLESFGACFDKILVDAPCSGEGMFRRDHNLIKAWKERGPAYYAAIQKEILSCAVRMLRPGGMLLYSTCTFSVEEDEASVLYVLEQFPEMELVSQELSDGFSQGEPPCVACVRLWPHRIKGEGHFLALLRRKTTECDSADSCGNTGTWDQGQANSGGQSALPVFDAQEIAASQSRMPPAVREFLEQIPGQLWRNCMYEQRKEQCLLLPPYRLPGKLRYLRTGIWAGTLKNGRFQPSQALAMLLDAGTFPNVVDFSSGDERALRYLRGETIDLTEKESEGRKGWTLVCTDGFALGWGKVVNGCLRNKYYPGWRIQ